MKFFTKIILKEVSSMKALMVNSTNGNVIEQKMRDEMYMKHLREVEKINNRQAEQIAKDLKTYRSINDLHHKNKANSFDWQHRMKQINILLQNKKIHRKIVDIRPYTRFKNLQVLEESKVKNILQEQGEVRGETSPVQSKQKKRKGLSLHYQYRKRRQEEIERQNQRLQKSLNSQRSTYLPKIKGRYNLTRIDKSNNFQKQFEDQLEEKEQLY